MSVSNLTRGPGDINRMTNGTVEGLQQTLRQIKAYIREMKTHEARSLPKQSVQGKPIAKTTPLLYMTSPQPHTDESCPIQDGDSTEPCITSPPYTGDTSLTAENENTEYRSVAKSQNRHKHRRPPNFLGLAIIVALCNCPLGVLATIFACLSTGDYSRGDIDGARSKGQVAKWLSIIGFVSSVLIAVMVAVYFLIIQPNIVRSWEQLLEG